MMLALLETFQVLKKNLAIKTPILETMNCPPIQYPMGAIWNSPPPPQRILYIIDVHYLRISLRH